MSLHYTTLARYALQCEAAVRRYREHQEKLRKLRDSMLFKIIDDWSDRITGNSFSQIIVDDPHNQEVPMCKDDELIYNSSTHGKIPLSFTGKRLLANLRDAIVGAIATRRYSANDNEVAKARGDLAKYISALESKEGQKGVGDQAEAWLSVCKALDAVYPSWTTLGDTGAESAVKAIRGLRFAPHPPEVETSEKADALAKEKAEAEKRQAARDRNIALASLIVRVANSLGREAASNTLAQFRTEYGNRATNLSSVQWKDYDALERKLNALLTPTYMAVADETVEARAQFSGAQVHAVVASFNFACADWFPAVSVPCRKVSEIKQQDWGLYLAKLRSLR